MRLQGIVILTGLMLLGWFAQPAFAIKQFQDQFYKIYLPEEEKTDFSEKVRQAKCWLCHQGRSRKNHNPYGIHLVKLLDRRKDAKNPEKITEVLKKVEKMHTDPKDKKSPTYADLMKAGKLPGGTLADCKKEPEKEDPENKLPE